MAFYKSLIIAGTLAAIGVMFLLTFGMRKQQQSMDIPSSMSMHYSGFEGYGEADFLLDRAVLYSQAEKLFVDYDTAAFPLKKKWTEEDYIGLADSVQAVLDKEQNLKNGDEITVTITYDEEKAKEMKVSLNAEPVKYTVSELEEGTRLLEDDIFAGISFTMEGISPMVTAVMENNVENDFLKTVQYEILDPKEYYSNGDVIRVQASFDPQSALNAHILAENSSYVREYPVEGFKQYVTSTEQLSQEALDRAIELGASYFTDPDSTGFTPANTYGLRIFTEAHLVTVWKGTNEYTFKWDSPKIVSGYLETLKEDKMDQEGMVYNHLELVYDVHITQGNGAGCYAETLVMFENVMIDEQGNIDFNEESGEVFAASYLDKNIKNVINGWNGQNYNVNRIESVQAAE